MPLNVQFRTAPWSRLYLYRPVWLGLCRLRSPHASHLNHAWSYEHILPHVCKHTGIDTSVCACDFLYTVLWSTKCFGRRAVHTQVVPTDNRWATHPKPLRNHDAGTWEQRGPGSRALLHFVKFRSSCASDTASQPRGPALWKDCGRTSRPSQAGLGPGCGCCNTCCFHVLPCCCFPKSLINYVTPPKKILEQS